MIRAFLLAVVVATVSFLPDVVVVVQGFSVPVPVHQQQQTCLFACSSSVVSRTATTTSPSLSGEGGIIGTPTATIMDHDGIILYPPSLDPSSVTLLMTTATTTTKTKEDDLEEANNGEAVATVAAVMTTTEAKTTLEEATTLEVSDTTTTTTSSSVNQDEGPATGPPLSSSSLVPSPHHATTITSTTTARLPSPVVLNTPIHSFGSIWDCLEFLHSLEGNCNKGNNIDNDDEQQQNKGNNNNQQQQEQQQQLQEWYIVKYYAPYCKVCQRASINYKKIAMEYIHNSQVHFIRVDAGSSMTPSDLRTLGITKFPFVQVYNYNGGGGGGGCQCVASFATGASHLFSKRVRDTLDEIVHTRTESEWNSFRHEFQHEMAENQRARQTLLLQRHRRLVEQEQDETDRAGKQHQNPLTTTTSTTTTTKDE